MMEKLKIYKRFAKGVSKGATMKKCKHSGKRNVMFYIINTYVCTGNEA